MRERRGKAVRNHRIDEVSVLPVKRVAVFLRGINLGRRRVTKEDDAAAPGAPSRLLARRPFSYSVGSIPRSRRPIPICPTW
jgi:hypothetical protein